MRVMNIRMPYDWADVDIENDNIEVFVDTDDDYTYVLSVATPKNIQFLMDKEKKDILGPGYPFIFVNKLTREIVEQAVTSFAEEAGGYWLKVYHFGGVYGVIDESIFNQLKAEHLEEERELDESFDELNE